MIVVGIGQIIAGTLLILSGWLLQSVFGIVCMAFGAYVLFNAFDHIDPTGV